MNFPEVFCQFLEKNNIPLSLYERGKELPRYVRVNPKILGFSKHQNYTKFLKEEIEKANQCEVWIEKVSYLENQFYQVTPGNVNISRTSLYLNGYLYGGDAASGFTVEALLRNIKKGEKQIRILDLCCAPGMKLCQIVDGLLQLGTDFSIVGCDIDEERLNACDTLVKKYFPGKEHEIYLHLGDGTKAFGMEVLKENYETTSEKSYESIEIDVNLHRWKSGGPAVFVNPAVSSSPLRSSLHPIPFQISSFT